MIYCASLIMNVDNYQVSREEHIFLLYFLFIYSCMFNVSSTEEKVAHQNYEIHLEERKLLPNKEGILISYLKLGFLIIALIFNTK